MRFFDLNIANISFPGTYSAICESANSDSCFDGLDYTYWSSNGYADDDLPIWVERDFNSPQIIDRVFIQDTNMSDISLQYWTGSVWATVLSTLQKSNDLRSVLFLFASLTTTKIRIVGSHTLLTADQEKILGSVFAFSEIGQLAIPTSGIQTKRGKDQDNHKLVSGKSFIFNRGRHWEIELSTQAHIGQEDIDLLQNIVKRDNDFYIWLNDNTEASMNQIVEPYAFKNILKVSVFGGENPTYYKNIWISGMTNKITLIEVE